MAEYTYKDIIIDPSSEEAKNAIGKEAYYSDNPTECLEYASNDDKNHLERFNGIEKYICPFNFGDFNYSCLIVKKEPCYEDQVKQWIEENNLKVGDYVKVTRRAENHADGLDDYWYDLMRDSVGKILKVKEISNFIMLDNGINYPYFVLEKAEKPEPKYVPFESKEEFIEAFHHHDNSKYSETDDILLNYGMWLKDKNSHEIFLVTGVFNQSIHICDFDSDESWGELLNEFTFLDGSPCGKLMEVKDL